jgi:hypothetical protein
MADQFLEKLFESVPKVRILRLFMQNPEYDFTFPELIKRTNFNSGTVKKELKKLLNIDLIKTKIVRIKSEQVFNKNKKSIQAKKTKIYYVNTGFELLKELHDLIIKSSITSRTKLSQRLKKLGKVKLVIISGIFINKDDARADLLVVGDNMKRGGLDKFLHQTESELGRHLQYTVMDTKEFRYRLDMYDRFLRDVLEGPHEKLINRLNI